MSEITLSPELQEALKNFQHVLTITNISRYLSIAGYVVLLYDVLLTLDKEIKLVWSARISLVKCLYFLVRYGSILLMAFPMYQMWPFRPAFTDRMCHISVSIGIAGKVICMAAANWLLLVRLGALYHGNRRILWPLYIFFAIAYGSAVGFAVATAVNTMPRVYFSPEVNLCVADRKYELMVGVYAAPFLLEVITFVLTVYKAVDSVEFVASPAGSARLLYVVIRDGLNYYLVMLLLRLWNIYIFGVLDINYYYLGVYNMWALVATFIGRLFLNVRDAANAQQWQAEPVSPHITSFVASRPRDMTYREESRYGDFVMELPMRSPVKSYPPSPMSGNSSDKTAMGIVWN